MSSVEGTGPIIPQRTEGTRGIPAGSMLTDSYADCPGAGRRAGLLSTLGRRSGVPQASPKPLVMQALSEVWHGPVLVLSHPLPAPAGGAGSHHHPGGRSVRRRDARAGIHRPGARKTRPGRDVVTR